MRWYIGLGDLKRCGLTLVFLAPDGPATENPSPSIRSPAMARRISRPVSCSRSSR
jgi:hypothetical protein